MLPSFISEKILFMVIKSSAFPPSNFKWNKASLCTTVGFSFVILFLHSHLVGNEPCFTMIKRKVSAEYFALCTQCNSEPASILIWIHSKNETFWPKHRSKREHISLCSGSHHNPTTNNQLQPCNCMASPNSEVVVYVHVLPQCHAFIISQ